jgi:glycosyltransferase involved in cell wall biosynthesis
MHGIEWMRTRWGFIARSFLKLMERASLPSAHAITAVSNTQCEYFKTNYNKNCEYIPTAADIKQLVNPNLISDLGLRARGYILFAARLVPEKGAHHLIRAYRRLSTEYPLVIAGEAPSAGNYSRELLELAEGDPRISFVGRVQGRLLEELFSNAALFVQPSELEGLSIGLLEAMSYGLPCIASDIPENQEVIGNTGLTFRNKDVDSLELVLDSTLRDMAGASKVAAAGRQRVKAMFSWERVVDQLEMLYQRAVNGADHQESVVPLGETAA